MKIFIVLALCAASALSAPSDAPKDVHKAPAIDHEEIHDEYGQFSFRYITLDGTLVEETGSLVPNKDGTDRVLVVKGMYSYVGPDGKTYVTRYSTGVDTGFQASGDHFPKAPEPEPVPVAAATISAPAIAPVSAPALYSAPAPSE